MGRGQGVSGVASAEVVEVAQGSPRAWWLAVGVLVLCGVIYFQTWRDLWPVWMDTDRTSYTHGPLVAAISLWLMWRLRPALRAAEVRPAWSALPVVLALSLAWLVASRAGILTVHTVLWPLVAATALVAACGWRIAGAFAFPLGYLWFAMPAWDYLSRLLQTITVVAVDALNGLTRVPAVVVGDTVLIPQGRFEIAAGCSGLHFFVIGLAIATLAGEVHRDRLRTRILLVALVAALALVANWLRVYFIILAGYLSDMQHYLVTVDHYKFGWLLFAIAMVGFFLILNRLPAAASARVETTGPAAPTRWAGGYVAGLAALCILPVTSLGAHAFNPRPAMPALAARAVAGYVGPLSPSPAWQPRFVGPDAEVRVAYLSPARHVIDYYGNRYVDQSQGHELIGYDNTLLDPATSRVVQQRRAVREVDGHALPVVEITTEMDGGGNWAVMYHYRVGSRVLAHPLAVQVASGFGSLWGSVPAELHAAAAPCTPDCDETLDELASLLAQLSRHE